mmetsp:Transcript_18813/g.32111  ORF Transcript_18813/g.32111 Transcript_18813/m.32111 type:complete len:233 (+) Transcript_18813:85-783(+)
MARMCSAGALLLLVLCWSSAGAVKIIVAPGQTECVSETVTAKHFDVPGGPRIDARILVTGYSQYYVPFISIKLIAPGGDQLWQQEHVYSESHMNVAARGPGSYKVCLHNPWESRTDAVVDLVYFTLAHLRSKGALRVPKGTHETRSTEIAHQDHMEDVKQVILGMSEFMQVMSGSQKYLQRKLDRHQKTMLSSKARTSWYAMLEVGTLVTVTLLQVAMITRFFKTGRIKLSV